MKKYGYCGVWEGFEIRDSSSQILISLNPQSVQNLPKKRTYGIGIAAIIIGLVFVLGFVNPAYAYIPITFDKPLYFYQHGAVITVDDTNDPNLSTNLSNGNMQVTLKSYANSIGNAYTFINIPGTNLFQSNGDIMFTDHTDSSSLQVNDNAYPNSDTVTAWVGVDSSSTLVYDGNYKTMPAANTNRQPNFSTTITCNASTSGDGICDEWKTPNSGSGVTITYTGVSGPNTFFFPCPTGDPCGYVGTKEIFVEVVAMKDQMPSTQAISDVQAAFARQGIKLHVYLDTEMDYHQTTITGPATGTTDFSNIKAATFGTADERNGNTSPCSTLPNTGTAPTQQDLCVQDLLTAKRQFFHYVLFANQQFQNPGSSGLSELPGNDVLVTMGPFTGGYGSVDQQEGSLMHELGHNLGLYHGGKDNLNCKPNYPSVMSYTQQLKDLNPYRPLDYSHGSWSALLQTSLKEPNGIGPTGSWSVYEPAAGGSPILTQTGIPTNYNPSTSDQEATQTLSYIKLYNVAAAGCSYTTNNNMYDYNDWGLLKFDIRTTSNFGSGAGGATASVTIAAQDVVSKTKTGVDGDLQDAIDDLKAANEPGVDLNGKLSSILGNLTNAKIKAQLDLDSVLSAKNYTDKTLENAGTNIDDAFANATVALNEKMRNTNDPVLLNSYRDLGGILQDSQQDVDKRISDARNDPNFLNYLEKNPDAGSFESTELTIGSAREMRNSHLQLINYTIMNLPQNDFMAYSVSKQQSDPRYTLSNQLADIENLVNTDQLPLAVSKLKDMKSEMDSSIGGNSQDDLITDYGAQAQLLKQVNEAILSYEAAATPSHSPYDGQYSSPAIPVIPIWIIYLLIGIAIGLLIYGLTFHAKYHKLKEHTKNHEPI